MKGYDDENHVDGPFEMATWDVSRAHFHGEPRKWIDTFLLEGHEQVGNLGRHMVRCVEGEFHESRNRVPSFLLQLRWRSQRIVSW